MNRILCLLFALLMVVSLLAGCGSANNEGIGSDGETKLSDLSGKKVGVMTGSIQAIKLPEMIPDSSQTFCFPLRLRLYPVAA